MKMHAPRFWSRPLGFWAALLLPLGWVYLAVGRLRHALTRPVRVGVPVICVGNATVGGTGKTPMVLALANRLRARGLHPHIVSRGYGGHEHGPHLVDAEEDTAAQVGDEPLLMAATLPVWVARDRVAGAMAARDAGADCVILDDGFQNPYLHKDISLLMVDGPAGFGNGCPLPAGPLRESLASARARADVAVVIGPTNPQTLAALAPLPVVSAQLQPRFTGLSLIGVRVVAFAGIGRPEKFFATLRGMGANVVRAIPFGDHEVLSDMMIRRLIATASAEEALLVTTEKDSVRLPRHLRNQMVTVMVDLVPADWSAIDAALDRLFPPESDFQPPAP